VQRQLIVVLALLMCAPSIMGALSGTLTIDALCARLAVAFVVSYVGVRMITRLIIGYAASSSRRAAPLADDQDDTTA
jgi:uncharacterized membrane protein YfcA